MVFCVLTLDTIVRKPTFSTAEYRRQSNALKLAGICNRSLLLSQLWVVSCKVVSQMSCVAEVFKLSSTHLTNCVGLVNSPLDFMKLKMLPYSDFQRLTVCLFSFLTSLLLIASANCFIAC